jgi:hypothetical protein
MNPILCRIIPPSSAFITLLLLVTPAAATLALSGVSCTPNPPLVIGGQQHLTATYYIGPSGATTFIRGHELQMETDLANARWNIQVLLNGRNAARQSASGSAAFVNGELISYSTNNDVSLEVTIDGVVPQTASDQVMVLQAEEIDNSGNLVPGSVITLSQPVTGPPVTAARTVLPLLTQPVILPSPTKSAGFPVISAILGSGLVLFIMVRRDG